MNRRKKSNRSRLARELARFVRHDTVCAHGNEAFARHIGHMLQRSGFSVSYQKERRLRDAFVNVIGVKGRSKGKRPILLCSHLDTVPPGELSKWTETKGDPWRARVKRDVLYGLGSADDKGPLLAMLEAARLSSKRQLKRPLMVMGTFGEESGMGGARLFKRAWKGPKPCCAFVGEPTSLGITYRHKGLGVIEIELSAPRNVLASKGAARKIVVFKGKQGHSSRPHEGENALEKAMDFLSREKSSSRHLLSIEGGSAANLIPARASLTFLKRSLNRTFDLSQPLLDCYSAVRGVVKRLRARKDRSFYPSTITSNFGVARTSGRVTKLVFDFRLLPGQSVTTIHRALRKTLSKRLRAYSGLKWRMRIERDNLPLDAQRNDSFVKMGARLLKSQHLPVRLSVKPSCTEAGVYQAWGIPSIIFGPGQSSGNVHAPNERIRIREVEHAIDFYQSAIQAFCVEGKQCS